MIDDLDISGKIIGSYLVETQLDRDGVGFVYRAQDTRSQRTVLMKFIQQELVDNPDFRQQFLKEASTAGKLKHPNIVEILAFDSVDSYLFVVTEYLKAGTLRDYCLPFQQQKFPLPLLQALDITRQVAAALHYAYQSHSLLHQNIKPENILLKLVDEPQGKVIIPYLTDFELEKLVQEYSDHTHIVNSGYAYMSPEQCLGERIDVRSDVYSLGIMLYELAVGRLPFMPTSLPEAIRMHTREDLPLPTTFNPNLPKPVERIIENCLQKKPNDRYQDGWAVARDLQTILNEITPKKPTKPLVEAAAPAASVSQTLVEATILERPAQVPEVELATKDRLVVKKDGLVVQEIVVRKLPLSIGRHAGNDVVLPADDKKVSRQHARLIQDDGGHYCIVDLGSMNSTFMDKDKTPLSADVPTPWKFGHSVKIGRYRLHLEENNADDGTRYDSSTIFSTLSNFQPIVPLDDVLLDEPEPIAPPPEPEPDILRINTQSTDVQLAAGGEAYVQIDVTNLGSEVDHFMLSIDELNADWFTINTPTVKLLPHSSDPTARASLRATIHPPRTSNSRAGRYTFPIHIHSRVHNKVVENLVGSLVIAPYYSFTTDLHPRRLQEKGTTYLEIHNMGNAADYYALTARDMEAALGFDMQITAGQISLEPDEKRRILIDVVQRNALKPGETRVYPFEVTVKSSKGENQVMNGEVTAAAPLPPPVVETTINAPGTPNLKMPSNLPLPSNRFVRWVNAVLKDINYFFGQIGKLLSEDMGGLLWRLGLGFVIILGLIFVFLMMMIMFRS